jgi:hypothetical protein
MIFEAVYDTPGLRPEARRDARIRAQKHFQKHFEGRDFDGIDVRSYLDQDLRRQAPRFWLQGTSGTPQTPAPGPTGQEARKGTSQVDVRLTEEEQKKGPQERMNIFRQREAAARGQQA